MEAHKIEIDIVSKLSPRTCKTCKWWGHFLTRRGDGRCKMPLHDPEVDPDLRGSNTMSGGTAGPATIWTGPDFGCIHHEPKEDGD